MPRKRSHFRLRVGLALAASALMAVFVFASSSSAGAWAVGTLTDAQLHSLVAQMTVDEEAGMVHGSTDSTCASLPVGCVGEAGWIPGVARLGIPPLRMTDGPGGVRLAHVETALPAPVALAATFDRKAANVYGSTVGNAGRATGQDVWLGPMINQVNYVTGGRDFETLGEDPYLDGELGAQEVVGVQNTGLIAELKHFIENDFENARTSASVAIDDQTLHETELQAFRAGIAAGAGSVMCSYNRINAVYGCANPATLQSILRGELGFTGFVQSDWGAVHRLSDLYYGNDIEQPSARNFTTAALESAVMNGTPAVAATADFPAVPAISAAAWKAALDGAVFNILSTMNKAGLLEGTRYGTHYTDGTPYVPQRPDLASLQSQDAATTTSLAEEGATLLKNDGKELPLKHNDVVHGVAVIGPTAVAPYVDGGGSSHVTPYDPVVSPYDALVSGTGSRASFTYAPGYDLDGKVLPASALTTPDPAVAYPNWTLTPADAALANQSGLLRQQITTASVPSGAQPALYTGADAAPDRVDATVDYTGSNTLPAGTAWRWTGTLTAPENPAGTAWQLKVFAENQASSQLFVDGLTTASRRVNIGAYPAAPSSSYAGLAETARSHDPANPLLQQASYSVTLTPGQQIHLDLRLLAGASPAHVQLRWVAPDAQSQAIAGAVAAAKTVGTAIVFAYDDGTEGSDRGGSNQTAGLNLPGYQNDLITAVSAANPNTIVVLNTGDPVLMPWASSVKSILEMWYPGQTGGIATADLLLGKANPGGKLPVTFPASTFPTGDANCTDTSVAGNCPIYPGVAGPSPFVTGATTSFRTITGMQVNGIFEGYRWYDAHNVAPLFPFGYGLSYTKFDYSKPSVTRALDGGLDVSFRVRNVGNQTGSDSPQVYIGPSPDLPASIQQAVHRLVQFDHVTLDPGHSVDATLHVTPHELSSWNSATQAWVLGTGARTIAVGSSSRDLPLQTTVTVTAHA